MYYIHFPLEDNTVLSVINFLIYSSISSSWNRIGYASRITLSISQVCYSRLRCFHCTLTCLTVWFQSKISLLSRIFFDRTWNSPSGSTWITFQSITWETSWTYIFKIEPWNILCTLILGVRANFYATDPTLARISNVFPYLGDKFLYLPNLKVLFLGFTFMYTWSPT